MFIKYIIYNSAIVFFIVQFIACGMQKEKGNDTGSHEIREIFIELEQKKTPKVEDIFKKIEYIPLETTDNILLSSGLGKGIKILFRNNQIYYADYYAIHVFDTKGRYLRKIYHKGESPAEYNSIGSFDVFNNDDILITNSSYLGILLYSDKDEFLRKYAADGSQINDIACLNDSIFVARRFYGNYDARFLFVNKNTFHPISKHTPIKNRRFQSTSGAFLRYGGKLLANESQNNNIYEITPDSAILRYTINIDNRMPPAGFWEQSDRDPMSLHEERNQKGYIDNIPFFSESDNSILLYYSGGSNPQGYVLIDKQSMQYTLFDEIEFENNFTWKPDYMFAQSDGQVIIPIPTDIILSLPETSNLRKRFGNLKEDDNPVLFIGILK